MSAHEEADLAETAPSIFLNTQIQSNLDMWEKEESIERSLVQLRKYSYNNSNMQTDANLVPEFAAPTPAIARLEKTYKKPATKDKLKESKAKKKPQKRKRKKEKEIGSISGHLAKVHAKRSEQESILKLLSGKRRKVNDIIDRIESIESKDFDSAEDNEPVEEKMVYTKDEWCNLLKVIRVNFPALSRKSKLSLSKINKIYYEQYDSQFQPTQESQPEESSSLWAMASTLPKTRLTDSDLKWLYDLDDVPAYDKLNENSILSSVSEIGKDDAEESNNVLTLSQLVNEHKNEVDANRQVIDLTQQSGDDGNQIPKGNSDSCGSVLITNTFDPKPIDVDGADVQEVSEPVDVEMEVEVPRISTHSSEKDASKTPTSKKIIEIPSSSPRISPIKISPTKIRQYKKNLKDDLKIKSPNAELNIKATISFKEQSHAPRRYPSNAESVRSIKSSASFHKPNHVDLPGPIKNFINEPDLYEVASVSDSGGEENELIRFVDGEYEIQVPDQTSPVFGYKPTIFGNENLKANDLEHSQQYSHTLPNNQPQDHKSASQILDDLLDSEDYNPQSRISNNNLDSQEYSNYIRHDSIDVLDSNIFTKESVIEDSESWKEKQNSDIILREVNQLKGVMNTSVSKTSSKEDILVNSASQVIPDSVNFGSLSNFYSTAQTQLHSNSLCNDSQSGGSPHQQNYNVRRYEFKGRINEVFQSPFKKIEANVRHERRQRDPYEIPDSQSLDDDEEDISIIEIKRVVKEDPFSTQKASPPGQIESTLLSSLSDNDDHNEDSNTSEMQVPSSPGFDITTASENKPSKASTLTSTSNVSKVSDKKQAESLLKKVPVPSLKMLTERWNFPISSTKVTIVATLAEIYCLLYQIAPNYMLLISETKYEKVTNDADKGIENTNNKLNSNSYNDDDDDSGGDNSAAVVDIEGEKLKQKRTKPDWETFYEQLCKISPQHVKPTIYNYLNTLISANRQIYQKMLTFAPVSLKEINDILVFHEIHFDAQVVRDWCDENSVTYSVALELTEEQKEAKKVKNASQLRRKPKAKSSVTKSAKVVNTTKIAKVTSAATSKKNGTTDVKKSRTLKKKDYGVSAVEGGGGIAVAAPNTDGDGSNINVVDAASVAHLQTEPAKKKARRRP